MFTRARPPNSFSPKSALQTSNMQKKQAKLQNEAEDFEIIKTASQKSLNKMAIELENILEDIAKERVLHLVLLNTAGAITHSAAEQEKLKGNTG